MDDRTLTALLSLAGIVLGSLGTWFKLRSDRERDDEQWVHQREAEITAYWRAELEFERARADRERERGDKWMMLYRDSISEIKQAAREINEAVGIDRGGSA